MWRPYVKRGKTQGGGLHAVLLPLATFRKGHLDARLASTFHAESDAPSLFPGILRRRTVVAFRFILSCVFSQALMRT